MNISKNRRRLAGQIIEDLELEGADLRNAIAPSSTWTDCTFRDSTFAQGNFGGAIFARCTFINCDFRQAILICRLNDCIFRDCDFDQANLTAAEIRDSTFDGGRAQYSSWERATVVDSDLGLSLHGARLDLAVGEGIDWTGANLWNALIPLGCAFFAGSTIDERQASMFLSLLCETSGGFDHEPVERVIDPTHRRAVMRLVRST